MELAVRELNNSESSESDGEVCNEISSVATRMNTFRRWYQYLAIANRLASDEITVPVRQLVSSVAYNAGVAQ